MESIVVVYIHYICLHCKYFDYEIHNLWLRPNLTYLKCSLQWIIYCTSTAYIVGIHICSEYQLSFLYPMFNFHKLLILYKCSQTKTEHLLSHLRKIKWPKSIISTNLVVQSVPFTGYIWGNHPDKSTKIFHDNALDIFTTVLFLAVKIFAVYTCS